MTEMEGIKYLGLVLFCVPWLLKIPVHDPKNIYQKMYQQ